MNHVTFGKSDRIDSSVLFFPSQSLPLKLNALRTSVFTELVSYWFNFHLCFGLANTTTSSNLINIILPWDFRGDFPGHQRSPVFPGASGLKFSLSFSMISNSSRAFGGTILTPGLGAWEGEAEDRKLFHKTWKKTNLKRIVWTKWPNQHEHSYTCYTKGRKGLAEEIPRNV